MGMFADFFMEYTHKENEPNFKGGACQIVSGVLLTILGFINRVRVMKDDDYEQADSFGCLFIMLEGFLDLGVGIAILYISVHIEEKDLEKFMGYTLPRLLIGIRYLECVTGAFVIAGYANDRRGIEDFESALLIWVIAKDTLIDLHYSAG